MLLPQYPLILRVRLISLILAGLFLVGSSSSVSAQGSNLAGSANGASVIAYSTEYAPGWEATQLIDGNTTTGWGSKSGAASSQWVLIILAGTGTSSIREIRINAGPVGGDTPAMALKDFHVEVSVDDVTYSTILSGSFSSTELNVTKSFVLSEPVDAWYVRLVVDSNQNPELTSYVDIAELEVYAEIQPPLTPTPTTSQPSDGQPTMGGAPRGDGGSTSAATSASNSTTSSAPAVGNFRTLAQFSAREEADGSIAVVTLSLASVEPGWLLKDFWGADTIYWVDEDRVLHPIPDIETFDARYEWKNVIPITSDQLAIQQIGDPVPSVIGG